VVVQNRSCSSLRDFHPLTERRKEVAIYEWVAEGKERKSARTTLDLRKRVANSASLYLFHLIFIPHSAAWTDGLRSYT
jgi:hypothetical protein